MQSNNTTNFENIIKQTAGKKRSLIFNFRKTYPAYIILMIFIAGSFAVRYFVKESVESNTRQEFNKSVSSISSRLNNHLERHEQVLQSLHGLYNENVEVVRDYFELYGAVPAKTYTSILSLAYVPNVSGSDWEAFHFSARSQGYFDFELKPSGVRAYYYPVLHAVLLEKNTDRIGFDYASVEDIKTAIEKARDENIEIASKAFNVRPDTLAFCLIKPIYYRGMPSTNLEERRKNFQASLVLEVDVAEFFHTGLSGSGGKISRTDESVVFDYSQAVDGKDQIVFKSKNFNLLETAYSPLFTEKVEFKIADRIYTGTFRTIPDFGGKFQAYIPTISFVGTLLSGLLFFAFVVSVITSRARAEDLAERMTRSQRRILEATKDIIGVLDFNGTWKSVNPAIEEVLGYNPDQFYSIPFESMFFDSKDVDNFKKNILSANTEKTEIMAIRMNKLNSSDILWVNWSFTVSKSDGLIYAIGRDVTIEKLAEHESIIKRKQIELAEQFALEASYSKSYFMIKLSHQLRNSLTGIIGYLQLLSNKFYDSEEEQMSYLNYAEQSSEEIFTFVSDIVDATIDQGESSIDSFVVTKIEPALRNALSVHNNTTQRNNITVNVDNSGTEPTALVNPKMLEKALVFAFNALCADMDNISLDAVIQENTHEGATEIQILGAGNTEIAELIKVYRENPNKIIETIKYDKNDIISNIAKAASHIRRLNGTMSVETFGGEEGNIVMITLPSVKRNG